MDFNHHCSVIIVLTRALTLIIISLGSTRALALAVPSFPSDITPDIDSYVSDINKVVLELIVPDSNVKPSADNPHPKTATTRTLTMTTDLITSDFVVLGWDDDIEGSADGVDRIGIKVFRYSGLEIYHVRKLYSPPNTECYVLPFILKNKKTVMEIGRGSAILLPPGRDSSSDSEISTADNHNDDDDDDDDDDNDNDNDGIETRTQPQREQEQEEDKAKEGKDDEKVEHKKKKKERKVSEKERIRKIIADYKAARQITGTGIHRVPFVAPLADEGVSGRIRGLACVRRHQRRYPLLKDTPDYY